jgi:hypothetical protein
LGEKKTFTKKPSVILIYKHYAIFQPESQGMVHITFEIRPAFR